MHIFSWNVNGIRAILRKNFKDFLSRYTPEVLFLQEIKIAQKDIEKEGLEFSGYETYWNPAQRPGYSGTAALVKKDLLKKNPLKQVSSIEKDEEGRAQFLEFKDFYLANIYFPNAGPDLGRMDFKIKFNNGLLREIKNLEKNKPFIIGGDYNVAREEIDLARPKQNVGNAGFTEEERAWMNKFLNSGFADTFRKFHPQTEKYTWWTYRAPGAREKNIGWRIDYFCVSDRILKRVQKSEILDNVQGSDHAPIKIKIT